MTREPATRAPISSYRNNQPLDKIRLLCGTGTTNGSCLPARPSRCAAGCKKRPGRPSGKLGFAESDKERIGIHEKIVALSRELEQAVDQLYQTGRVPQPDL